MYVIIVCLSVYVLQLWRRVPGPALWHINMTAMFHHKAISRMKAEDLLLAVNEDGRFLIRDSETFPGAHVLCLL